MCLVINNYFITYLIIYLYTCSNIIIMSGLISYYVVENNSLVTTRSMTILYVTMVISHVFYVVLYEWVVSIISWKIFCVWN